MPVALTTPYTPQVPNFTHVHLDHMTIVRDRTNYAKTQIQARVRPYYLDPQTNDKIFCLESQELFIEDAEAWSRELAEKNDLRGVQASDHIKAMVALLVETKTNFGTTQLL